MNTDWLIDIPDGTDGQWTVEHFDVSKDDEAFQKMRLYNPSSMGRWAPAGHYNALRCDGAVVMSTTPDELRDLTFLERALGNVLITGLGLGCAASCALAQPCVKHVTVIEKDASVIRLVEPTLRASGYNGRLDVVHDDAFTWKAPRGSRYDMAWHDIWPSICSDNLAEMKRLKSRFRHRTKRQGCWCESECRWASRRGI